jgi:hypothetical protein
MSKPTYNIEVTDTFGGEANYCWVKRGTTTARSRRGKIEAAKRLAGWTGWCRVKASDYGDVMEIRPTESSGVCQIAFVTFDYS